MSDPQNFNYGDLWYVKTAEGGKNPIISWGGYSQDFESADRVYSHDEVFENDHEYWGVVGTTGIDHGQMSVLVFDLDVHKAPDDFDISDIDIPADTAVVRSRSGGFHVYFFVHAARGEGSENDFVMTEDLGWDIDIRGSYVSHHVIAPADIPGVGGEYELVNDERVAAVFDPAEAAERIEYKGEPLLEYDRETGIGDFEFERAADPPDEMPTCYHAGLELRKAAPDDHPNTHKVNVLTALCGLANGYGVDDVVEHFCGEWAPGGAADVDETTYQVKHLARHMERGRYAPPAVSTLREWGILDADETCSCSIDYHGKRQRPSLDIVEDRDVAAEAAAVAGAETDGGASQLERRGRSEDDRRRAFERDARSAIEAANDDEIQQRTARQRIAESLMTNWSFIFPEEGVPEWRSALYVYDPEVGVYEPRGDRFIDKRLEVACGDWSTNEVSSQVKGKIKRRCAVREGTLDNDPFRLVVGNGIIDLRTGELDPYTPDEHHRVRLETDWNPDAGEPDAIDEFFHDIVDDRDAPTLYRLVAHTLVKKYITEKAAMLLGDGENGKTVFLNLVENFLSEWNVSNRELQDFDGKNFTVNSLQGKLANIAGDMSGQGITDMSTFKELTGGDSIMADVKFESPIKFKNHATLLFSANEMPVFGEDNHAVWRRWIYLNFPYTFDASDPSAKDPVPEHVLMDRLTDEREFEALLFRCQREIQAWWEGRDFFPDIMSPDEVREKMKRASEPVYHFASVCLEPADASDDDGWVEKRLVRKCYTEFATEESLPKIAENQFGEELLSLRDFNIETGRRRRDGERLTTYQNVTLSSRGRQILGLDGPENEDQSTVEESSGSAKRDVLLAVRTLVEENDNEPVTEDMVIGHALSQMGMGRAQHALEELKKQGDVMVVDGKVIDT